MILLWEWKKGLFASLFRRLQIKMTKFINTKLESESESDTELESKSELESDT